MSPPNLPPPGEIADARPAPFAKARPECQHRPARAVVLSVSAISEPRYALDAQYGTDPGVPCFTLDVIKCQQAGGRQSMALLFLTVAEAVVAKHAMQGTSPARICPVLAA